MMVIVLAKRSLKVRRDKSDDHAVHDVFGANDMKNVVKVLGVVMKLGAHALVLCSSLYFAAWYKAIALENMEMQASTREDSTTLCTNTAETESVEIMPVFEIGSLPC